MMRLKTRFLRRFLVLLTVLLLAAAAGRPLSFAAAPEATEPPMSTANDGPALGLPSSPGSWWVWTPESTGVGETIYHKPVLVFVHGKSENALTWAYDTVYYGWNSMAHWALEAGHRIAFVNLHPDQDSFTNGAMLNYLLGRITAHFGVSKVAIVAHSKGGLDTNVASAFYGAHQYINQVITIQSPHHGSPLADMAFSTPMWAVAAVMGDLNASTFQLMTGNMAFVRMMADYFLYDPVYYFNYGGHSCSPFGTALWFSCAFVMWNTPNDGLVPTWSVYQGNGFRMGIYPWDHDYGRRGQASWNVIRGVAAINFDYWAFGSELPDGIPPQSDEPVPAPSVPGNLILRGNMVHGRPGTPSDELVVESGVGRAAFIFHATSEHFRATLVGPDGSSYSVKADSLIEDPANVLAGTWTGTVVIDSPAAGTWSVYTSALPDYTLPIQCEKAAEPALKKMPNCDPPEQEGEVGYFLIASLESDLVATMAVPGLAAPGTMTDLAVSFEGRTPVSIKVEGQVTQNGVQLYTISSGDSSTMMTADGIKTSVSLGSAAAVYGVTLNVSGILEDGSAFERTLVTSFAAADLEEIQRWTTADWERFFGAR